MKPTESLYNFAIRRNNDLAVIGIILALIAMLVGIGAFLHAIVGTSPIVSFILLFFPFAIFFVGFGMFCHRYKEYSPNGTIQDSQPQGFQVTTAQEEPAKELEGEIETILAWKKWRSYIYDLFHRDASDKRRFEALSHKFFMYCEWLIGFFKITVPGRYLAFIFAIAVTFGPVVYELDSQKKAARLQASFNAVAQAEFFSLELQKNDDILKNLSRGYSYGASTGLKEALEYLHETGHGFDSVYLPRTYLKGAKLEKAILYHSVLNGAYLVGAKLNRANLIFANLSKADLQNANLIRANLIRANLEDTNLESADLRGANLLGAKFDKTDITDADFSGAKNLTPFQIMHACIYPYEEGRKPPQLPSYFEDFRDFRYFKNFKNFKNFMNLKSFKDFRDFGDFDIKEIPDCDMVEQF